MWSLPKEAASMRAFSIGLMFQLHRRALIVTEANQSPRGGTLGEPSTLLSPTRNWMSHFFVDRPAIMGLNYPNAKE